MSKEEFLEILEDSYISPFRWDIVTQGHMEGVECVGGNCIKLAKIPNGISVYWNSKNDFETACLLDDINRGLKIIEMGCKTYKQFRNFYFWSVGEISDEVTDTEIIIEISGNAPHIEYFLSSPSNIGVIGKVDVIGKIENVENVGNVPTPTPPPEDPEELYKNVQYEHTLMLKATQGNILMLLSANGDRIDNNYTLNNAKSSMLFAVARIADYYGSVSETKPQVVSMLPLGLAEKYFPNAWAISQQNTSVSYTTLSKGSNLNYITSYNCGGNDGLYQTATPPIETNFYNVLKWLCELRNITLQAEIDEIAHNLVVLKCTNGVNGARLNQLIGKSGMGDLFPLTTPITIHFAALNYPKHFQYKNNSYANTYNAASIVVGKGVQFQVDNNPIQSIPDTPIDKVNLQSEIYKLWD